MVRSIRHAAYAGLTQHGERGNVHLPTFAAWAQYWSDGVSAVYLKAYFERIGKTGLFPAGEIELRAMLQAFLLHRMLHELNHELGVRSDKVKIPLQDILQLIGNPAAGVSGRISIFG